MDGDPAIEPEIDGFTRILPLPYRVALIIVLGMHSPVSDWLSPGLLLPFPYPIPPTLLATDNLHRHMGMGPQPSLPLPHKDRRPLSNPLSIARLATPPTASPLLLPYRNFPLHPSRPLAFPFLGDYPR